jgi:hypothetical protein
MGQCWNDTDRGNLKYWEENIILLPPTLYNVFLPVLRFSPVSIIPPLLHTHLHLKVSLTNTDGRSL